MQNKLNLSVSIISFNEENNIARTLESVCDIASEIIIIDSHSTDNTIEIAKKFNAKIFIEDWKGHVAQKNSALDKCSNEWILMLDCDEVVSEKLKNSIIDAIKNPKFDGYSLNRKTFYLGKLLNYAWQPDWNLRLAKKSSSPYWRGLDPHDELKITGTTGKLDGELIHYSYKNIRQHFEKTLDYARICAESYYQKNRRFSFLNLILNPIVAFVRLYFVHKGFLDGFIGFIAAFSSCYYTFMKYLFLWEKYLDKKL